jgi:hypothetical protein
VSVIQVAFISKVSEFVERLYGGLILKETNTGVPGQLVAVIFSELAPETTGQEVVIDKF